MPHSRKAYACPVGMESSATRVGDAAETARGRAAAAVTGLKSAAIFTSAVIFATVSGSFTADAVIAKITDVAEIQLQPMPFPDTQDNHSIKLRARCSAGSGNSIGFALYEGVNNRSGDLNQPLTNTLTDYEVAIGDTEAATIVSYDALEIHWWGIGISGATTFHLDAIGLNIPAGTRTSSFTADAYIGAAAAGGDFTADAVIEKAASGSVTADAVIEKSQTGSFTTDAVLKASDTGSFTADAVLKASQTGSFDADAVIFKSGQAGSFTAAAWILTPVEGSFTADSIALRSQAGSISSDAVL